MWFHFTHYAQVLSESALVGHVPIFKTTMATSVSRRSALQLLHSRVLKGINHAENHI